MKNITVMNDDSVVVVCKLYGEEAKEFLEKCEGQKVTICGVISTKDCVNGYTVDALKIK